MESDYRLPEKLLNPYNPIETETEIYKLWETSGFFNPDTSVKEGLIKKDAQAFTIVLPPPNVTGILHMGHALGITLQDILIRYKRMRGFKTLWIPGTDHAAIATQSKVETGIKKKENKSRYDLGREDFLKRVVLFAQESHDTIVSQIRALGASCDWSREAFTLDESRNLAVRTIFKMLYDDGLIYRGHRIVNWDPKGQTTISDDEIIYAERDAVLYTFRYSKDFPIPIATTRPETKVGDTAVAVNPDDERYKQFVGKEYDVEFCGVPLHLKIIADNEVDKEFGTGALGVTPAHSSIDWDMAERHDLNRPQVIDEKARMMVDNDNLKGKKTTEAREIIIDWLKKENLIEKEEPIKQNVATAERSGGIIEPLPKLQWFLSVDKPFTLKYSELIGIPSGSIVTFKQILRAVVENGQINILPDHFTKTYFHWIDNLKDWCISRQIWYGHQIPVWYKGDLTYCDINPPTGLDWVRDEDTLDTWFSSGLWSFSTLGWPEKTDDLKTYHPNDVIVPAYEILFFWIARMILMSTYALGQIPFHTVYLTGIVRDEKGQKFSKSLGNGIDPIDIAKKFGADAARMALVIGSSPGTDMRISEEKIKGYKHFANKLWNITRFVLSNIQISKNKEILLTNEEQEIKKEFLSLIEEVTEDMDKFRFHIAGEKIYHYIWHTFADKIIEESKLIFKDGTPSEKESRSLLLLFLLENSLSILHPFMPYVTEEIQTMMPEKRLLMITAWPSYV